MCSKCQKNAVTIAEILTPFWRSFSGGAVIRCTFQSIKEPTQK